VVQLLVDILDEVLSRCLQQEDLVVVVPMMRQIAAFLAHELVMDDTKGHVRLHVVLALGRGLRLRLVVSGLASVVVLGPKSRALAVAALPIIL